MAFDHDTAPWTDISHSRKCNSFYQYATTSILPLIHLHNQNIFAYHGRPLKLHLPGISLYMRRISHSENKGTSHMVPDLRAE